MVDIEEIKKKPVPGHIAVIMDGNRRWAKENNLATIKGHEAGVKALENLIDFFSSNPDLKIKHITLYSLSEDNQNKRTPEQFNALMIIFKKGFSKLANDKRLNDQGIKISVFGDYATLPKDVVQEIDNCINITKNNKKLFINFCIAYDGQSEITKACKEISKKVKNNELNENDITKSTVKNHLFTADFPAPELIIRSGKQKRLSSFLLWDSSYSELHFCDKYWPDITSNDFLEAIEQFQKTNRNFGQ